MKTKNKIKNLGLSCVICFGISLASLNSFAQQAWEKLESGVTVELRGLSVVNNNVAWASGAKGTVIKTVDGKTWTNLSLPDAHDLDFRDIHAFNEKVAYIMSAGPGKASKIYKTADGGKTWSMLIENQIPLGFWNAIDFWDEQTGAVFGDPIDGHFQVLMTRDGGVTWNPITKELTNLKANLNEGAFAASGTCMVISATGDILFVTGASEFARIFHSRDRGRTWQVSASHVTAKEASQGLFSIHMATSKLGMAVGGDYKQTQLSYQHASITRDGGKTWSAIEVPLGFLSTVTSVNSKKTQLPVLLAGGLDGSAWSHDAGKTWQRIGNTPLNTLAFSKQGQAWAIGPRGLVMKLGVQVQ
jgi:photosystem II stability/assembly factor-like uncharacterized protein